ncbi:adenosylcobinamide-phosphate synthase, partial [candidate division KSB1 bacterium]
MDKTYQVLFAYLADILLGDPVWFPHPVRLMGSMIVRLERFLRRFSFSEKVGGI